MAEIICQDCGKRMFHENEDTLKMEDTIHKQFCRKKEGSAERYMHREKSEQAPMDEERSTDHEGKAILKR